MAYVPLLLKYEINDKLIVDVLCLTLQKCMVILVKNNFLSS